MARQWDGPLWRRASRRLSSLSLSLLRHADSVSLTSFLPPPPAQAERNNGRAAMMGILGMVTHNALGVDALFPIVQ